MIAPASISFTHSVSLYSVLLFVAFGYEVYLTLMSCVKDGLTF